ncbi:MAG: glycosyltransferase family 9 protein, partial [Nitrospirae bacterium]|nr:glycosyltransferase family 9 protein [Nitrospirota bacterium]
MDRNVKEILIIRTAYIGDAVMALPMLKPLKMKFPEAHITFLTSEKAKDIFFNNPYITETIAYDPFWFYNSSKGKYIGFIREMMKRRFDIVIEARGDIRELLLIAFPLKAKVKIGFGFGGGAFILDHVVPYISKKHKLEYHLDLIKYLGCEVADIEWGIYLTESELGKIKEIMESHGISRPFITVHPGARHPLRRWLTERYAELYDSLIEKYNMPLVILGSPGETGLAENIIGTMKHKPISLAGKLSLRELAGVLAESLLFICNNSGPLHIAAAMKTPVVVLHGPSKSYWDAPYGNISRIVEKDFPCRDNCDETSCLNKRFHACINDITVEEVLSAADDILNTLKMNLP